MMPPNPYGMKRTLARHRGCLRSASALFSVLVLMGCSQQPVATPSASRSEIMAPTSRAADHAEIAIELNVTRRSRTATNSYSIAATCIVGSNRWYFSGDFLKNATVEYWPLGTNVVEHKTITSSMYLAQAEEFVREEILGEKPRTPVELGISYPRAGETVTRVRPSLSGQPSFTGVAGVVWLAFCSGDFLKREHRQIPKPIGPSTRTLVYEDKTVLFDDSFGLPKSVKLFTPNGMLTCEYEAQAVTNFLGRTFPLEFRVMQLSMGGSTTELEGRVVSIRPGQWRELPVEFRTELVP